ncbi:MAG: amino acid adenylation domain-containing protein [Kiloniellales bacterium]|nr:amino acid adenylation domain-containing protein [Kiloniellales bacterium]
MQHDLLHLSVTRAAEKTPDKVAFRFLDRGLSYAELEDRSARVAAMLQEQGVRRGDRVALYLNKSLESAIALFAIMRAGAAYVPLDPGAPPDRTRAVLSQSGARVAVTHEVKRRDAGAALSGGLDCVVGLDAPLDGAERWVSWEDALAMPPAPLDQTAVSELDLAYIIFTSGSTGTPKGIMHSHASGMSYARMAARLYDLRPEDRLSNASPLHFDMSTFDYFCAPLAGATTVVFSEAHKKLPASLAELAESERLTVWYSVPFLLIQLLLHGALEERDLSSLRWILFGGEPFVPKHLVALMERLPGARFSNVYGPAEVNQCTYYHLPAGYRETDGPAPIGSMCPNADALVVDEADRAVEPGETGELLVRTSTMMRGYWERPDLNARCFYKRPAPGGVDDVYYRTGDLVSQRPDGTLSFLGRKDHQVKTRGYRVELEEVEAALAAHEDVAEAAAFVVTCEDGLHLIQAAVSLRPNRSAQAEGLTAFAAQRLPSYALPQRISFLEEFPRTTSGKIDRNHLRQDADLALSGEG